MVRLLFGLAFLGGACALPPPDASETEQEIIGGSNIPGQYMNVVFLMAKNSAGKPLWSCTGSLITPSVVMTAAHCVDGAENAASYELHFADAYNFSTKMFVAEVDTVVHTADVVWFHPDFSETTLRNDIGLVHLDKPAPASVTPLTINRYRVTKAWVGREVHMVGFGLRTAAGNDNGIKTEGFNMISSVQDSGGIYQTLGAVQTCQGDSGGPNFITIEGREMISGITSFTGNATTCNTVPAGYTRVDFQLDEIDDFIAKHDPQTTRDCGADGKCGILCPGVDPDCPCQGDGQCTMACADPDMDPDCPLNCKKDSVCQRSGCPVKDPDCGDKSVGATCGGNDECMTGLCVPEGSSKICAASCSPTAACGSGFTCTANVCLKDGGGGGCECAAGRGDRSPGAGLLGGWLALAAAVWLGRRRR